MPGYFRPFLAVDAVLLFITLPPSYAYTKIRRCCCVRLPLTGYTLAADD